jgi:hypothetical protein
MMNETSAQIDLCRENFVYFLYDLRNHRNQCNQFSGKYILSGTLLSDSVIEDLLRFNKEIFSDEIFTLIKKHERKIGVTTFLAFYSYYKSFYTPCNIFWVSNAKMFSHYSKILNEISIVLQNVMKTTVAVKAPTKEVQFSHNGSSIKFLNDTTYEFRPFKDKIDLVIFDGAQIHNFEKLTFFLDSIAIDNSNVADKVVMNFDVEREKSKEFIEVLEKRFVGDTKIIENLI